MHVVDGAALAVHIKEQLALELGSTRPPVLGFVRSGDDLVAKKFVGMKRATAEDIGIRVIEETLPRDADTATAIAAVERVAQGADGVIVQMPLGKSIDTAAVLAAVPIEKDVDAMGERSGKLVLTPVVGAIAEILANESVPVAGKKTVVVGAGRLVGAPAAAWLQAQGALVQVVTKDSGDMLKELQDAEVVVLGAGVPGMVTPNMLRPGVVLLDAGTSEEGGTLRGDADPMCAEVASLFTPVPGGIGPVAVAMIFKNLLTLARKK